MTRRVAAVAAVLGLAALAVWLFSNRVEAVGEQPPPKAPVKWEYATLNRYTQALWNAGDVQIIARDWKDLAEKLKVPLKEGQNNPELIQATVLNHLGSQGWELVAQSSMPLNPNGSFEMYTFKRPVP